MKLWDKGYSVNEKIEKFTVGKDRELDLFLAPFDIQGTMAHISMLESVGLLRREELDLLLPELQKLLDEAKAGRFVIEPDIEDVHSQVEALLTRKLGNLGKKVHTGRSRNDQVLVDLKLFARDAIKRLAGMTKELFDAFQESSERYKNVLMPGYTHLQVAMPSSFGLWFGAYAESLASDMNELLAAYKVVNCNPLGSAAGYGSSAPLNRKMTTDLLGFEDLDYNSIYAQMSRGKSERIVAFALSCIAETLGRFAMDCCLFNSQNFKFVKLPDELTTGSSIMPHKKNPDLFELLRAHCNRLCGVPENIRLICTNLPSGYFRDMQLIKEIYVPIFSEMEDCLDIALFAVRNMTVESDIMDDPKYRLAFSVEEVNRLVSEEDVPFRDAYRKVADDIASGKFEYKGKLSHTHEGSIGNLCNREICAKFEKIFEQIV